MNTHFAKVLFAILLVLSLSAGSVCAADQEVLARVKGKPITQKDLERLIGFYPESQQAVLRSNAEARETLLKNLVTIMVVTDIARKKNYDKKKDIRQQLQLIRDEYLAKSYLEKEIVGKVQVSDRDAEEYYKKNQAVFTKPEQVRARHILIAVPPGASDADKQAARKKATEILERIKKGEDFAKLASEYSDDPGSKKKGGDLGFLARNATVPEFDQAAFALEPGGVSGIVETSFGFHIIKVEEKKKAETPPFETVKEDAKALALQAAKQETVNRFIEQSFKKAGVEFYAKPAEKKN
jgi:peptidyl-prolyl cis-trans isomerase C